jgi:soluble lytic murein transglycosylase-like protein
MEESVVVAAIGAALTLFFLLTKRAEGSTLPKSSTNVPKVEKVRTLDDIIFEKAQKYNINPLLIKAHIQVESSWDVDAENPNDPSYGLMGISAMLAQDYGLCRDWRNITPEEVENIKNPDNNIDAGARFLNYLHLYKKYPFDVATQMYNCGERGYNEKGIRVPEYLAKIRKYYNA